MGRTTITAHAGCLGTPEDSIESVVAGIRAGVDICEVDVNLDVTGAPVLKHDGVLPGDMGLVPLSDVLRLIRGTDLKLNLDIKALSAVPAAERLVMEVGLSDRMFFTGLFEDDVRQVAESGSGISRYLNFNIMPDEDGGLNEALATARRCGCVGINSSYYGVTREAVEKVHAAGLLLSVWTVDDIDTMRDMITMGVDNITTRRPDLAGKLIPLSPVGDIPP